MGGVSNLDFTLNLNEFGTWERLVFEKAVPNYLRGSDQFGCHLFLWVQASMSGSPTGFWMIFCVLWESPGGTVRFFFFLEMLVPIIVSFGSVGWERSGHGLTSRPRETSSVGMRDELLCLLWSILCVRVRFGAEGPPLELAAVDEVAKLLLSRVEDVGVSSCFCGRPFACRCACCDWRSWRLLDRGNWRFLEEGAAYQNNSMFQFSKKPKK